MRLITCASYYGTGSSAITDYISEFDKCYSLGDYEFRFIQDPEGICDLEYNLIDNHHRHNSGHSLKRFKRLVDFNAGNKFVKKYEPFFNNKWKVISYEYIEQLTDFSQIGYWHQDVIDRGYFFYFRKRLFNKVLVQTIWRNKERGLIELPKEITLYSRPSKEKFINLTRDYLEKLFKEANKEGKDDLMVDQLVPPSNLSRYLEYFKDIKVFVVDRDPRDLYLLEKCIWKGRIIPVETPELFVKWYKYTREHRKYEDYDFDKVMVVQFEDLVYKYEQTTEKIKVWLGYNDKNHINKNKYLVPEKSKKNTKLWEKYPEYQEDIKYIETELKDVLYNYPK